MNLKIFFAIFATVFLAELGDKTQLATLLFASDNENSKLVVFLAAAAALILSSAVAVLVGHTLGKHINPKYFSWIAGIGFIIIGIWTITKA
jgi:putative Ca2+/H+ antiporter (TMEM165/GDT1 family)